MKRFKKIWRKIFGEPIDRSSYMVYKIKEVTRFGESNLFIALEYNSVWFSGFGRYLIERYTLKSSDKKECLEWIEWRKNRPSIKVENV